jgi:anhydro-N-acetylmuramic acid kinase
MTHTDKQILRVLGLMSGTSMDGVDAAIIETDGAGYVRAQSHLTVPYPAQFRGRLRAVLGTSGDSAMARDVETELTRAHADAVQTLQRSDGGAVDLIGFHGHTIFHDPARRFTRQIGDGAELARLTGVPVVNDFRTADVAAGGQGAPLVPLYHQALATGLERPVAVLNIGGVANVTYLGAGDPIAFDTGPGNALIDDLFLARTGTALDEGGQVAARGIVDQAILKRMLDHPYFDRPVPKSLDRDAFDGRLVADLPLENAAATLVAFTAHSVARACAFFPEMPKRWLVTGGGRHNAAIMASLSHLLDTPIEPAPVQPVEALGWDGDALEAQAFAYLAVRSLRRLPLTLPTTTGVVTPLSGGTLHNP